MYWLAFVLLLLGGGTAASPNLVENADLRNFDLETGQPVSWRNSPALSGLRISYPDRTDRYALRLAAFQNGENAFWIGTLAPIEPGVRYRFTARIKVPLNSYFRVYVERVKPEFQAFNGARWESGTGQWQTVSFCFSYNTPGSQPYLVFCVNTPADCLATDFNLTPLSELKDVK